MNNKRLSIAGTTMKLLNGFGVYSYSSPVINRQIICPSKPFLNRYAKRCEPFHYFSSDYLSLQAIFEPTRQALWASPVITHHITFPSNPISNQHAKRCEPVPSLSSYYLLLQSIFKPTRQDLWSIPINPHHIHHSSMTPLEQGNFSLLLIMHLLLPYFPLVGPSKPFLNRYAKRCEPFHYFSSDYLSLQAIFEPTRQALWASPVITHHITFPSNPISNQHAKRCEPVPSLSSYYLLLQSIFKPTRQDLWSIPINPHHIHHSSMTPLEQGNFSLLLIMHLLLPYFPLVDKDPYTRPFFCFGKKAL